MLSWRGCAQLVSGHTPDGWRSNNLFGDVKNNAPGDDDYEVVQINLVARGFVVLAFDPIGQGERMQYADVPQGKPDPTAPWSHGANGSFLWGSTADHEYMGQWLCEFSGGGASLPKIGPATLERAAVACCISVSADACASGDVIPFERSAAAA